MDVSTPTVVLGIFVSGGVGAVLRFAVAAAVDAALASRVPQAGVVTCNFLGCLLIGAAAALIPPGWWRAVVMTGLLGGFTTYSAFALFSTELLQATRYAVFAAHLAAQVLGGITAVLAGFAIARRFVD